VKLLTTVVVGMLTQSVFATGIGISTNSVTGLPDPTGDSDAATKAYVDNSAPPAGIEIGDLQYWDGAAWVLRQNESV